MSGDYIVAAYNFVSSSNVPRGPVNVLVVNRLHIESCELHVRIVNITANTSTATRRRHVPMVGMVVTTSPSFSLYSTVVFPAASRPLKGQAGISWNKWHHFPRSGPLTYHTSRCVFLCLHTVDGTNASRQIHQFPFFLWLLRSMGFVLKCFESSFYYHLIYTSLLRTCICDDVIKTILGHAKTETVNCRSPSPP